MATLTIELPEGAFSALRRSPQEFAKEMRIAARVTKQAWKISFWNILIFQRNARIPRAALLTRSELAHCQNSRTVKPAEPPFRRKGSVPLCRITGRGRVTLLNYYAAESCFFRPASKSIDETLSRRIWFACVPIDSCTIPIRLMSR